MNQLAAKHERPTAWRMVAWVWGAVGAAVVGGFLIGFLVDLAIDGRWDDLPYRTVVGVLSAIGLPFISVYFLMQASEEVKLAVLPRLVLWVSAVAAGVGAGFEELVVAGVMLAVTLAVAVYLSLRVSSGRLGATRRSGASRRELLEKSSHQRS